MARLKNTAVKSTKTAKAKATPDDVILLRTAMRVAVEVLHDMASSVRVIASIGLSSNTEEGAAANRECLRLAAQARSVAERLTKVANGEVSL